MTEKEIFQRNLELSTEFSKYLLEHPELEPQIPQDVQVLFLDESDPSLSQWNMEMAKKQKQAGQPVMFVHVKGLRPEISRLIEPRLEKASGF